jgi:phage shock protein PspC (stress-responsive transcriptional regulator)
MTDWTPPTTRRNNPLYKDPVDKKIGGVASGVARYFDIDTTLVRTVWALSILIGGFGLLLYLVLWFILEDDPALLAGSAQSAVVTSPIQPLQSEDAVDNPINGEDHQTG